MPFPPPSELLPHADGAVLIDEVVADSPDQTTVIANITAAHPYFVVGRGVPVWVGMEMMAQTVAARGGLLGGSDTRRSRRGMLLGIRHYDGRVPWFTEGSRLLIHGQHAFGREGGGLAACDCRIEHDGQLLARATLVIVEEIDP
ncbi:MAG: hypothetical protein L0H73_01190 [Nitrococcus sp.]|nr:hypothetical protein [Nitrococcus sp.]